MHSPLIRSFEAFDDAAAAQADMVAAGLPADTLNLRVLQDEAGPVEGNFLVGNGRETTDDPYTTNFKHAITRGAFLLEVHTADASLRELADSVFRRHRCTDAVAAGARARPG
ncbi:MAG: hypothetical protein JWP47_1702 [Polaromonas sp.]|jgi:hypothetical protein|nr:hypothetical protein [Polaromonas sp.]